MEDLRYVFVAVLVAISIFSVIFCIVRGRGASRKMLILITALFGIVAMICLGGEAVLEHFGMGWRCTPFNTMLIIGAFLFIIMLGFTMKELSIFNDTNPTIVKCGFISIVLTIFIVIMVITSYFYLSNWHDGLTTYNNQTIIYATDQHGGSCSWRYYNHINSLVHGSEITQDGWWGYTPFKS